MDYYKTIFQKDLNLIAEAIRTVKNNKCELCGTGNNQIHFKTNKTVTLKVYPIDNNCQNVSKHNLILLCDVCHSRLANMDKYNLPNTERDDKRYWATQLGL